MLNDNYEFEIEINNNWVEVYCTKLDISRDEDDLQSINYGKVFWKDGKEFSDDDYDHYQSGIIDGIKRWYLED